MFWKLTFWISIWVDGGHCVIFRCGKWSKYRRWCKLEMGDASQCHPPHINQTGRLQNQEMASHANFQLKAWHYGCTEKYDIQGEVFDFAAVFAVKSEEIRILAQLLNIPKLQISPQGTQLLWQWANIAEDISGLMELDWLESMLDVQQLRVQVDIVHFNQRCCKVRRDKKADASFRKVSPRPLGGRDGTTSSASLVLCFVF